MAHKVSRRGFIKTVGAGATAVSLCSALGLSQVRSVRAAKDSYKMVFIQFMPHTVSAAWSTGIEEVLKVISSVTRERMVSWKG